MSCNGSCTLQIVLVISNNYIATVVESYLKASICIAGRDLYSFWESGLNPGKKNQLCRIWYLRTLNFYMFLYLILICYLHLKDTDCFTTSKVRYSRRKIGFHQRIHNLQIQNYRSILNYPKGSRLEGKFKSSSVLLLLSSLITKSSSKWNGFGTAIRLILTKLLLTWSNVEEDWQLSVMELLIIENCQS